MRLSTAIAQFLSEIMIDRSLNTQKAYSGDLNLLKAIATVAHSDNVTSFTADVVRAYFKRESDLGHGAETLIRRRSALSEFAKWALRRRLITENPMLEAAPRLRHPKREPRPFAREERERLLALEVDADDTVLRGLLFYAGLRVSEVAGLRWKHVRLSVPGQRGALRILGKGDKERIVPLWLELDAILRTYLAPEHQQRRVLEGGFVLERKGVPWRIARIETHVARWGTRVDPVVADCIPHRWRHSCATWLFEQGMDVRFTQRFLGHESITTTMRYVQVTDEAMEQALSDAETKRMYLPNCIHVPPGVPAKSSE